MPSRNDLQRATMDGLQIEDVSQDRTMLVGLAAAEHELLAIEATAADPATRQISARALGIIRALMAAEVEDLRRHRLRGDLSAFQEREARRQTVKRTAQNEGRAHV